MENLNLSSADNNDDKKQNRLPKKTKKKQKKELERVPRSKLYKSDFMNYYGCCSKTATVRMKEVREKQNLPPNSNINITHFSKAENCTEEEMRRMLKIY